MDQCKWLIYVNEGIAKLTTLLVLGKHEQSLEVYFQYPHNVTIMSLTMR